jgi:hypothetical protein
MTSNDADQGDGAFFDVRQDCVLLGLVEAVDLVDEQHGPQARPTVDLGLDHDLAKVSDPGGHSGHRHHPGAGFRGQQAGQRRLSASGRTPQDDARKVA